MLFESIPGKRSLHSSSIEMRGLYISYIVKVQVPILEYIYPKTVPNC